MKFKIKNEFIIVGILIATIVSACTFNRTYINRPEDIGKGKLFLNSFYNCIANKNHDSLALITSDTLNKMSGNNALSKIAILVNNKAGNYRYYTVVDSSARRSEGSNDETIYKFKVKVPQSGGESVGRGGEQRRLVTMKRNVC